MAAKQKKAPKELDVNEQLDEKLESVKAGGKPLIDLFQYADEYNDLDVTCVSTGFASLDTLFHPQLMGLPRGRVIEIFSPDGNVGKSTITRQILKNWQSLGLETALAEPEKTDTQAYWDQLGIITARDSKVPAMRIMRPRWDLSSDEATLYSAEQFLDAVLAASEIMDLIVLDSIDALVKACDQEKDSDESDTVGGISKLLSSFFRKYVNKRAALLCVNQMRYAIGKFSHSGTPMTTTGGKAPSFYATIRVKMTRIGTLKEDDEGADPFGFLTKFETVKNKISPQDRSCVIPYVHGEGFSQSFDLFNLATKLKMIDKQKGGWYQFPAGDADKNKALKNDPNFTRIRGKLNMYRELRDNPVLFNVVKSLIDGEDVDPATVEVPPGVPAQTETVQ